MKKQSFALAFFASIVQYYDYALFGLSASILAKTYMPNASESEQYLSFFTILSAASLTRPLGSLIFGYIGDLRGRSFVLKISCLLAAVSTLSIGLIPFEAGISSALFMTICRMVFMMSQSGEGDGVRIYIAESIGFEREYFGNSLVTCCSQGGALLASAMCFLASKDFMPAYWWRINFIIGGALGIAVFIMRARFEESGEFANYCNKKMNNSKTDGFNIRTFFTATLISGAIGGIYHFYIIFTGTYLVKMVPADIVDYAPSVPTIIIILYIIMSPLAGYLADKFNARTQVKWSIGLMILISFLNAILMARSEFQIILFLISAAAMPFFAVPLQIMLKRIMPIESRLRIFSLSHSAGAIIFSSSVPLICSWIWYSTKLGWLPLLYTPFMGLLILFALNFTRKS